MEYQIQKVCLKCSKSIGVLLLSDNETNDVNDFYKGYNLISSFSDYVQELMNTILNKIEQDNFINPLTGSKANFFENVICINIPNNISTIDFNLSKEIKDKLIQNGEDATNKFFTKNQ